MTDIVRVLADLRQGRPVVVIDEDAPLRMGALVVAADVITPAAMAFLVRHSSGFVCVAIPEQVADRLLLPEMVSGSTGLFGSAQAVSVDASAGVSTGISASDRARTAQLLAAPTTVADDLSRPGHVIPLRAKAGGVLERAWHCEAGVDLAELAGCNPAAVLATLVSQDRPTEMADHDELVAFAARYDLGVVTIAELKSHRLVSSGAVRRSATGTTVLSGRNFMTFGYEVERVPAAQAVIVPAASLRPASATSPIYVHVGCELGALCGIAPCGCREQLYSALSTIGGIGHGAIISLTGQYASSAPAREDVGATLTTEHALVAGRILLDLGLTNVRPMNRSEALDDALRSIGIDVAYCEDERIAPAQIG